MASGTRGARCLRVLAENCAGRLLAEQQRDTDPMIFIAFVELRGV
jgi:hypothetical protein